MAKTRIFFITLVILSWVGLASAEQKSVSLVTYYPPPQGAYALLRLIPKAGAYTPPEPCLPGTMYVSAQGILRYCYGSDSGSWNYLSGNWIQEGANVYEHNYASLTNPSQLFGIGTNDPESELEVRSRSSDGNTEVTLSGDSNNTGGIINFPRENDADPVQTQEYWQIQGVPGSTFELNVPNADESNKLELQTDGGLKIPGKLQWSFYISDGVNPIAPLSVVYIDGEYYLKSAP